MRARILFTLLAVGLALAVAAPSAYASGGGGEKGEKKEKAKAPKKQRSLTSLPSWVMVDPYTIPIIQDGRLRGRLSVSFGMDVPDDKLRETAEMLMPRLRDAWLTELNLYASTALRPKRAGDITAVCNLLQRSADAVLQKAGSKVLMGSVIVQMTP